MATWTVAELEGVFDLRVSLEPQLTALRRPERRRPPTSTELDDLAHRMVEVGSPGARQDLDALVPLNRAFHDRLVALAAHPTLATALAAAIHPPIVRRNFHAYDAESLRRSLAHHLEIVAALRAGDPGWARAVMTAHISQRAGRDGPRGHGRDPAGPPAMRRPHELPARSRRRRHVHRRAAGGGGQRRAPGGPRPPRPPPTSRSACCTASARSARRPGIELSEVAQVLHGTTVATNAILEGKGATVGLVTTKGFRQVLQIARSFVPGGLAGWIIWPKPEPLADAGEHRRGRRADRQRRHRGAGRSTRTTSGPS